MKTLEAIRFISQISESEIDGLEVWEKGTSALVCIIAHREKVKQAIADGYRYDIQRARRLRRHLNRIERILTVFLHTDFGYQLNRARNYKRWEQSN